MRILVFIAGITAFFFLFENRITSVPDYPQIILNKDVSRHIAMDNFIPDKNMELIQKPSVFPVLNDLTDKAGRRILEKETSNSPLLKTVVPVLAFVIIVFFFGSMFFFFAVFHIKTRRLYKERRKKKTGEKYMNIIADYLIKREQHEYPVFPGLRNALNRGVLIEQIYSLSQNLFGQKQNKLLKLFRIRRLLRHVLFHIAISGKARKAAYLKLFAVIILNRYLKDKFSKYLFTRHSELRRFAQLSCLNYDTNLLQEILHDYPYYLTLWDQIHFFEVIERRGTIPPDFYIYLKSSNPTVIIFGLRMIRVFYQKSENENQIVELLKHSHEDIRYEALKTVSELHIEGVNRVLLAYLSEIGEKYKSLIIEYLIKNNLLDDQMLLEFFYREKKDLDRLNILKTIYNTYSNGQSMVTDIKNTTKEEKVRSMCTYILENAL